MRLNLCNWFGQVSYVISSGMIFKIYGCFLLGFLFGPLEWGWRTLTYGKWYALAR